MTKKKESLKFEEILEKVDATINKLQSGELELDKSIDEFKEGLDLISQAQKKLNEAKLKVQEVIKDKEGLSLKDL